MLKLSILICVVLFLISGSATQATVKIDSFTFGAIEARSIGPATMSGRIMSIDAVNKEPRIFYVGTASGGLWKTINGGLTFKPVFDKHTQSIGAVTIDQSKPETIWVGTGEADTRNSVSVGTGIYKSTDAGESWQLMGLEKTERIAKVAIDPKDSNVVYAAATGHLWDSSEDRGVYKTIDGGKTWEKIFFVNADTGCADLEIDPQNPSIVYAAMWQFRRKPYFFTSGGPGSGLYKSTDAGKTWRKLSKGLPEGELGRIAIGLAPSKSSVLYANVEAKKTALYRSDDSGETWTRTHTSFNIQARPFYFSHLIVDPTDHNKVYKPGFFLSFSNDAGVSFSSLATSTHSDHHALWINPNNPFHLLLGTDGGVYASFDKGNTWKILRSLPVSQFYHVTADMKNPYNVYGGLQDNGSWMGPSQSVNGIENKDWKNVGFGDGFHVWADPSNDDVVYAEFQGGQILRHHKSSNEMKSIKPYTKEGEPDLRFNWNTPIELSPKNPKVIYVGSQYLHRSSTMGESWERISPDLTTNDPQKQKQEDSGGLTVDNSTAENHCTIFTISASPLDENVIWAGTDDGNVQVTQNGGKNWSNVTANVPELPKNTWVSSIESSAHDPATAFATFDGHQTGDMKVYVYKTSDFGKTWKSIATDNIKGYAHIIRQDLVNPDLLFVGTEFGLFLTVDGGLQWAQFTGGLPNVSVRDLMIHPRESDVVIATHGRGIYIIDDITPIRKLNQQTLESKVAFLESRPAQARFLRFAQDFPGDDEFVGSNTPDAAIITYYLKDRHVFGDLKLEVYDAEGKLISTLPGGKRKGINRVTWFTRLKPPKTPPSPQLGGGVLFGPTVPQGTYTVKMIKGDETFSSQINIVPDSTLPHSEEDRKLQFNTSMKLYRMQEQLAFLADSTTSLRDQARERAGKLAKGDETAKGLNAYADKLDKFHKTLVATKEGFITGEEQLREKVVELYLFVSSYGGRPTASQLENAEKLSKELQKSEATFQTLSGKELESLNAKLTNKKLEPITLKTMEEWLKEQK
jgi:photosystem II stability/assembly factor-like uncharacterized protein